LEIDRAWLPPHSVKGVKSFVAVAEEKVHQFIELAWVGACTGIDKLLKDAEPWDEGFARLASVMLNAAELMEREFLPIQFVIPDISRKA
jgi:hypothetical protein